MVFGGRHFIFSRWSKAELEPVNDEGLILKTLEIVSIQQKGQGKSLRQADACN
jgi:hypothetical protein